MCGRYTGFIDDSRELLDIYTKARSLYPDVNFRSKVWRMSISAQRSSSMIIALYMVPSSHEMPKAPTEFRIRRSAGFCPCRKI